MMTDGPTAGQPIEGRIYIMSVAITSSSAEFPPETRTSEAHVTVLPDGTAKNFSVCFPPA